MTSISREILKVRISLMLKHLTRLRQFDSLTLIDSKFFHRAIPYKPMGKYAHFLTIRITESYPLFQTDGELNKYRSHY